ncbi:sterol desaturase-related protein [mine drainage metagenome]|uniref:Sterol desaturase-related protein n=1 Tax=mine drainage metagenome TaxID=410659 RepID=T1BSP8_9ZZZZ
MATEAWVRIGSFAGLFILFYAFERIWPRRPRRTQGYIRNLLLAPLGSLASRILIPGGLVLFAASWHEGLFHWLDLAPLAGIPVGVLVLDFTIYLQHRLFHRIPWLWRLHRVHHSDLDLDVTCGIRFHPGEIFLSTLIKLTVIALLGLSAPAVLVFEVLLNATSLFNHSNLVIGASWDRRLRRLVVTPAMHEIHHSAWPGELDRNFGFNFPWWDHWLGTYRAQSRAPDPIPIGLPGQHGRGLGFWQMLWDPFRSRPQVRPETPLT